MDLLYAWDKLTEKQQEKMGKAELQEPLMLDFGHRQVCVIKLNDGFHAVANNCPHAGAQLHIGACNKKGLLICPAHGYKFDVRTGRSADGNGYTLKTFRIKEKDGAYYLGTRRF
jgi:nitrite reductase/ring-hydroxylating ferredoxin subunit